MVETNPQRFLQYTLLPDGSGFKLPDGNEFKFDEFGGWYDEFNNYFNSTGTKSQPKKPKIKEQEIKKNEEVPCQRFLQYTMLEDKSGFQLMDGSRFIFDKFGGWLLRFQKFDEENNYYNSAAIRCAPPEQQKSLNEEQNNLKNKVFTQIQQHIQKNQQSEKVQKDQKIKTVQKVSKDLIDQVMNYYEKNSPSSELQFYFKFDNVYLKRSELILMLTKDQSEIKIKNFQFDYEESDNKKKKGTGSFICGNKVSAIYCAQCNDMYFENSLFQISLEPFQQQQNEKHQKKNKDKNGLETDFIVNKHLFE